MALVLSIVCVIFGAYLSYASKQNIQGKILQYISMQVYLGPIMISGFTGFDELFSLTYILCSKLGKIKITRHNIILITIMLLVVAHTVIGYVSMTLHYGYGKITTLRYLIFALNIYFIIYSTQKITKIESLKFEYNSRSIFYLIFLTSFFVFHEIFQGSSGCAQNAQINTSLCPRSNNILSIWGTTAYNASIILAILSLRYVKINNQSSVVTMLILLICFMFFAFTSTRSGILLLIVFYLLIISRSMYKVKTFASAVIVIIAASVYVTVNSSIYQELISTFAFNSIEQVHDYDRLAWSLSILLFTYDFPLLAFFGSGFNTASFLLGPYVVEAFKFVGVIKAFDSNVAVTGIGNLIISIGYLGFGLIIAQMSISWWSHRDTGLRPILVATVLCFINFFTINSVDQIFWWSFLALSTIKKGDVS